MSAGPDFMSSFLRSSFLESPFFVSGACTGTGTGTYTYFTSGVGLGVGVGVAMGTYTKSRHLMTSQLQLHTLPSLQKDAHALWVRHQLSLVSQYGLQFRVRSSCMRRVHSPGRELMQSQARVVPI